MRYSTEQLRQKAVSAHKNGHAITTIADMYGVHRVTVHRWINRSKNDASISRLPGSGRPSVLTDLQAARLLKIVLKPASKYGFETDFWTSSRLMAITKKKLKVVVSRSTMCKMLRDADYSYKKPEPRYYEANDEARKEWSEITVPQIKETVRKYRAILYFEDEANIRLTGVLARTWGPRGERTIQQVTGVRGNVPVASAISPKGQLLFQLYDKMITSEEVIEFLSQMLNYHPRRHIVVVMDRARPHTSKATADFIASQPRLHVFYLPPYSPDMNPDEQIWNHMKNEELKGHQATNTMELKALARRKLRKLAKNENTLHALFFRSCVADFFA